MDATEEGSAARREVMGLLARASVAQLCSAFAMLDPEPGVTDIRAPETGLVMVRGRIGGGGRQFNLGEATVTRATIRLASGTAGFSHVLGRDRRHARLAAIFDALWQDDPGQLSALLEDLRAAASASDRRVAEETAATRVDFFTLVRGEDP
jgi:alpha-D-ribose 1-methylphosphonate 5-triphosphate synthase subunit PhnG